MLKKKYYTISEVAEYLGVSQSALRYVEKSIAKFKVSTINNRRYYTESNIKILQEKMRKPLDYNTIIFKIDCLEKQSKKIMDIITPILW